MSTHKEKCEHHAIVLREHGYPKTADARDHTKYCTCCKQPFEVHEEYRSFTSHMHEECIRELLLPGGSPQIGDKPPRFITEQRKMSFAPPVVAVSVPPSTPPANRDAIVNELAEKVADQVAWLSEENQEVFIKAIADEVIARLKPVLMRWEEAVEHLEEMLTSE